MNKEITPLSGYPLEYGLLCAALQDATKDWRGEIQEDLSPEAMTWRPRPGAQSMGAILLHMIIVEIFWFEDFVLSKPWDREEAELIMAGKIDVDSGDWPEVYAQPLSWYLELRDKVRARTLESIKSWPAPGTLIDREGESAKYSTDWVLSHVVQHESYHGGQIVLLNSLREASTN